MLLLFEFYNDIQNKNINYNITVYVLVYNNVVRWYYDTGF